METYGYEQHSFGFKLGLGFGASVPKGPGGDVSYGFGTQSTTTYSHEKAYLMAFYMIKKYRFSMEKVPTAALLGIEKEL